MLCRYALPSVVPRSWDPQHFPAWNQHPGWSECIDSNKTWLTGSVCKGWNSALDVASWLQRFCQNIRAWKIFSAAKMKTLNSVQDILINIPRKLREFPQYSSRQASGSGFHVALGVTRITSVSGLRYTTYQVYAVKCSITVYIQYILHTIKSYLAIPKFKLPGNCLPPTPSHQPEMRSKVLHCPMDRCFDQTSKEDLLETSSCQTLVRFDQINRNNSSFSLNWVCHSARNQSDRQNGMASAN